jgi:nucleotide-binding universal stress UspA family protein
MQTISKILVPTDLSPVAELGLKLAVEIAKRTGATISLINFTRHPLGQTFTAMGELSAKVDPEEERFTVQLLHAHKEKLQALDAKYSAAGVTIHHEIVDDELKDGVDAYLHHEGIDLVVMGTSGEERGEEVFKGNHTEQVIKISSCPVLSVRDGFNIADFDKIVLAVSKIESAHVHEGLKTLSDLADAFGSHIYLVHVREHGSDSHTDLRPAFTQLAEAAGFKNFSVTILEGSDSAAEVVKFARESKAGLIGVIKNSKDGIFRIFSEHFSNRLVKEVGRPVFTYNLQHA